MEKKADNLMDTAWKMVCSGNEENAMLAINALAGAKNFPSSEDALCALMNHVWIHGTQEDRKEISKVGDGAKPGGWHWGMNGGGRGLAEYKGVIISYNARFYMDARLSEHPNFKALGQSRFLPAIQKVVEAVEKAKKDVEEAVNSYCSMVSKNDPHDVGAALFLYNRLVSQPIYNHLPMEDWVVQQKLMSGIFSKPPFEKGQHVEHDGNIFEIISAKLNRSGINMEWDIRTCSLKKGGSTNNSTRSISVRSADVHKIKPTDISDWEWSAKERRFVKKR